MSWLPHTKLLRPESGIDILDRPRLLEQLRRQVTSARLTLVSAPAGAGKTTLVASLGQHFPDLPLVWISLDEEDDRPETFLSLLITAADRFLPAGSRNAAAVMASQPQLVMEPSRLIGLLINDILENDLDPFVLVLDDAHVLEDETCLAALDYLLAHLPPMMHLVATARRDPPLALARLRARGQLAELRMAHLRFSVEETAAWFKAKLGLTLSAGNLALVTRQTEGWVTALRLLALSLAELSPEAQDRFIQDLAHDQPLITDYLMEEVVRRLPPATRRFLQETSILTTATPRLCQAVTGRADAGEQLEMVYRQNLFVSRSDAPEGDEPAYRYHTMLRQALQQTLRRRHPSRVVELHRRAADALGHSPAAVDHLLAAERPDLAADRLETLIRHQVELGTMPADLVERVARLPEPLVAERPWLLAGQGIRLLHRGHREQGRPLLGAAARQLSDAGDELSRAYLLFNLSTVSVGAEMAAYLEEIGAVFAARGEDVPARWWVDYHQAMVWRSLHASDWPAVEHHLDSAVDNAIRSGEAGAFYTLAANNFTHFFYSARAAAAVLRLRDTLATRFPAKDLLARFGVMNISLCQHWYQAEPEPAERLSRQVQGLSRRHGVFTWADVNAMLILMYVRWMRDDLAALARELNGILDHIARTAAWRVAHNDMLCWLALVQWREGRASEVDRYLPAMEAATFFERQRLNTALVRALAASAAGDLAAADSHLRDAIARQRAAGFTTTVGARLLLAVLYWQAGERDAALRELDIGLGEWQRRDLPGVVLQTGRAIAPLLEAAMAQGLRADFAGRCLAAFGLEAPPRALFVPATGETLTPREVEVLALITRGLTNPAIAASLVISENTVKSHVRKVLAKMGVARRTEAAMLARELGLSSE